MSIYKLNTRTPAWTPTPKSHRWRGCRPFGRGMWHRDPIEDEQMQARFAVTDRLFPELAP
jgi:hypothetical protein